MQTSLHTQGKGVQSLRGDRSAPARAARKPYRWNLSSHPGPPGAGPGHVPVRAGAAGKEPPPRAPAAAEWPGRGGAERGVAPGSARPGQAPSYPARPGPPPSPKGAAAIGRAVPAEPRSHRTGSLLLLLPVPAPPPVPPARWRSSGRPPPRT